MIIKGTIIRVDTDEAFVRLSISSHGKACSSCSDEDHGTRRFLSVPTYNDAAVGDIVTMEISSRSVLFSAFMFFILPLAMLFFGILLSGALLRFFGVTVGKGFLKIATGLVLMAGAFVAVYFTDKRNSRRKALAPYVISIEKHFDRELSAHGICCKESHKL